MYGGRRRGGTPSVLHSPPLPFFPRPSQGPPRPAYCVCTLHGPTTRRQEDRYKPHCDATDLLGMCTAYRGVTPELLGHPFPSSPPPAPQAQRLLADASERTATDCGPRARRSYLPFPPSPLPQAQRSLADASERAATDRGDGQRAVLRLRDEVAYEEGRRWRDKLAATELVSSACAEQCTRGVFKCGGVEHMSVGVWNQVWNRVPWCGGTSRWSAVSRAQLFVSVLFTLGKPCPQAT